MTTWDARRGLQQQVADRLPVPDLISHGRPWVSKIFVQKCSWNSNAFNQIWPWGSSLDGLMWLSGCHLLWRSWHTCAESKDAIYIDYASVGRVHPTWLLHCELLCAQLGGRDERGQTGQGPWRRQLPRGGSWSGTMRWRGEEQIHSLQTRLVPARRNWAGKPPLTSGQSAPSDKLK